MLQEVRDILRQALVLGEQVDRLDASSPLLGSIRELDSVGVMAVVAAMEENYGIEVDDVEITPEVFATLGSLSDFLQAKMA